MSVQVIIYSSDRIRGGILKEILRRNKIGTLLLDKIMDVKSSISSHQPAIVIFDTTSSLKNEINFLKNLSSSIDDHFTIFVGDPLIINTLHDFHQNNIQKQDNLKIEGNLHNKIFLSDPLDPDVIISKSLDILYGYPENHEERQLLETDLRQYLKLD